MSIERVGPRWPATWSNPCERWRSSDGPSSSAIKANSIPRSSSKTRLTVAVSPRAVLARPWPTGSNGATWRRYGNRSMSIWIGFAVTLGSLRRCPPPNNPSKTGGGWENSQILTSGGLKACFARVAQDLILAKIEKRVGVGQTACLSPLLPIPCDADRYEVARPRALRLSSCALISFTSKKGIKAPVARRPVKAGRSTRKMCRYQRGSASDRFEASGISGYQ